MRTIYVSICGILMLISALIPPTILIIKMLFSDSGL